MCATAQETSQGERQRVARHSTASGVWWVGAVLPMALLRAGAQQGVGDLIWQILAWGLTLLFVLAGLWLPRRERFGQGLATAALLGLWILATQILSLSPRAVLAALIATTSSLAMLWQVGSAWMSPNLRHPRPLYLGQTHGAVWGAVALWLLWSFADLGRGAVDSALVGVPVLLSIVLGLEWALRNWRQQVWQVTSFGIALLVATLLSLHVWGQWWWMMSAWVLVSLTLLWFTRPQPHTEVATGSWLEPFLGHPERLFVGTFAALSVLGAVFLDLPQSLQTVHSLGLMDALFTSTSAVCVTGLVVVDTPTTFSAFGQAVLLLLIQMGGLGIMTFSTMALWAMGRRMSLRYEGAVASLMSSQDRGHLYATAKRIVLLTLYTEIGGAVLLTGAFLQQGDRLGMALWRGLFTSVSAFCNAGFALQTDSLIPYQHNPFVLHVVALLIIIGGISPLVVFALPQLLRRSMVPVSAQIKLSLWVSVLLLGLGFVFIAAFEWRDSLASLDGWDRLHNAWFQSVTLRTAGFNSVDFSGLRGATLTIFVAWMFIGGSPGGTAGGIKTTTLAVLVLSVVQAIRGQQSVEIFAKRISERTRFKASVTVTIAVAIVISALLALQLTQHMSTRQAAFEVVSALGTVGLSIGGTAELDGIGKAIIILCMFIGRVGGLTLLMFLSNHRYSPTLQRPEEEIEVG